jgi:lipopolysaccharide/colanic/teichoic acid biosynthesis glycosyltransferase
MREDDEDAAVREKDALHGFSKLFVALDGLIIQPSWPKRGGHATTERVKQQGLPLILKRATDLAIAGAVTLATAPIVGAAAVAVRLTMGAPVFFRQKRPGKNEVPFDCIKFRTMNDARDASGRLLPDEQRLTRIGKLLRTTSVDELPQLWSVIRGDMSLVGPRPLLMRYLDRYSSEQHRRHEVMPGITGWAAVNGRNALSWDEKFALDLWYVDHWSPLLDLAILAKTAVGVLRREGISSEGHATMPEFFGPQSHQVLE